jgi:hypothetical protein
MNRQRKSTSANKAKFIQIADIIKQCVKNLPRYIFTTSSKRLEVLNLNMFDLSIL